MHSYHLKASVMVQRVSSPLSCEDTLLQFKFHIVPYGFRSVADVDVVQVGLWLYTGLVCCSLAG